MKIPPIAAAFLLAPALALAPLAASAQQQGAPMQRGGAGKSAGPAMQMHQHMMEGSRQAMRMKSSGDIDRDFATMMRQHHRMGIQMAEQEVQSGKDPEMKELAQKILDSQKEEVKQFDEWLAEHKGSGGAAAQGGSSGGKEK